MVDVVRLWVQFSFCIFIAAGLSHLGFSLQYFVLLWLTVSKGWFACMYGLDLLCSFFMCFGRSDFVLKLFLLLMLDFEALSFRDDCRLNESPSANQPTHF